MGKKLAIKGHRTRGKEVIELLEMMGGTNPFSKNDGMVIGNKTTNCYYISDYTATKYISWDYIGPEEIDKYEIFNLEDFLEKYPFRAGDKVMDGYGDTLTIKSMGWSADCQTMVYDFKDSVIVLAAEDLKPVDDTDDDTKQTEETITPTPDITANVTDKNNCDIQCPDGYEFYDENGNLIGTKVMMRPKTSVYPKTFKECRAILNYMEGNMSGYKASLFASMQDLLICRDAYWKIAGEEMSLGKPWEPEYIATNRTNYFTICGFNCKIAKSCTSNRNVILAFPTEAMRDAFYKNFKDLIESCKELL